MMKLLKWLYPGLRIKRWLCLIFMGLLLVGFGVAFISGELFLRLEQGPGRVFYTFTGQEITLLGGILSIFGGALLLSWGLHQIFRSLRGTLWPSSSEPLVDVLYQRRLLKNGPRVVVLGGGTGLSVLLRGLKDYTSNITAIVTVTDDGGSSGRLRTELGVLPPGDFRNCLVALADKETVMDEVLSYRFKQGQGLTGHTLGNLLLVALSEMAGGFVQAIQELSKVLAVRGQVLPATLAPAVLGAEMMDGKIVEGETQITAQKGHIKRVYLKPSQPQPVEASLKALAQAEAIILGPGSLYTSILPNLLVEGIVTAIRQAPAKKIYICNVMTQPGETDGYTAADHIQALYDHCGTNLVDYILVNQGQAQRKRLKKYEVQGAYAVKVDTDRLTEQGVRVVQEDLLDLSDLVRHHPQRLAKTVIDIIMADEPRMNKRINE